MTDILSYDYQELKTSLIEYLQSSDEFGDFNYEGSALLTIIDLLVRNTHYIGYMANMVGTESFLDSAVLRANIISHAQKLSYKPSTITASRMQGTITVTPSSTPVENFITAKKGQIFYSTVDNNTYQFVLYSDTTLSKTINNTFTATGVEFVQGQLVSNKFLYSEGISSLTIPNSNVDRQTISLTVNGAQFTEASDITLHGKDDNVFYTSINTNNQIEIEFGKDILGMEPSAGSEIVVSYVVAEENYANGLSTLYSSIPIGGYSNIDVDVTVHAYGGSDEESAERIKFLSPRIYQTQNRAVVDTSYADIAMREFNFISSAKSWGGENNIPPTPGFVYIAVIPEDDYVIVDNLKTLIASKVEEFSMMSVVVVEPSYLGLNVLADIKVDNTVNSLSNSQNISNVTEVIEKYKDKIKKFNFYYEDSELLCDIKELSGIYSVETFLELEYNIEVPQNTISNYYIDFKNPIDEQSISAENLTLDINQTGAEIYDKDGIVYKRITMGSMVSEESIGTVDYQTGIISFDILVLGNEFQIKAKPIRKNVKVDTDTVIQINDISVSVV